MSRECEKYSKWLKLAGVSYYKFHEWLLKQPSVQTAWDNCLWPNEMMRIFALTNPPKKVLTMAWDYLESLTKKGHWKTNHKLYTDSVSILEMKKWETEASSIYWIEDEIELFTLNLSLAAKGENFNKDATDVIRRHSPMAPFVNMSIKEIGKRVYLRPEHGSLPVECRTRTAYDSITEYYNDPRM